MAFVSSLQVFYEMRFCTRFFIMLYTEDFSMRHYVGFSQIGSQLFISYPIQKYFTTKYFHVIIFNCESFVQTVCVRVCGRDGRY